MNPPTRHLLWVSLLLLLPAANLPASDFDKEQRWSDQIVDSILDGEPVWLMADGHQFLSIFTPADNDSRENGLIVMHGIGVHPNWDQVIRPLPLSVQSGGNLMFQQQEIEGANHFFDDKNDELVDAVDDWLKTLP